MLSITWQNISGGQILLLAGIVALAFTLWKASPIGSDAVESWKSLAEGRWEELKEARDDLTSQSETIGDLQDQVHARELDVEKQKAEIARLNERPDTATMLATFQKHHEQNQEILRRIMANQEEGIKALAVLVDRHRDRRSSDPPADL